MISKLKMTCKRTVVAYFKILFQCLLARNGGSHENFLSRYQLIGPRFGLWSFRIWTRIKHSTAKLQLPSYL